MYHSMVRIRGFKYVWITLVCQCFVVLNDLFSAFPAFCKHVGLGLRIDGSRDHEIKIKDFPDVQVGNWMDWQPEEAISGRERSCRAI